MASPSTPTALTGAISEERLTTAKDTQSVLLLQGFQHRYELIEDYPIPELQSDDEVLIRNAVVGLNPIDWKAPYVHARIATPVLCANVLVIIILVYHTSRIYLVANLSEQSARRTLLPG